jgi:hypothetical protein
MGKSVFFTITQFHFRGDFLICLNKGLCQAQHDTLIDLLVFNANVSRISAIWWSEQILYIRHLLIT